MRRSPSTRATHIGKAIVVEVAGIPVSTDSVSTAIDLAIEAARRSRGPTPTTKHTTAPRTATVSTASESTLSAWERFTAHLRRPERKSALLLLHHLKDRTGKGTYVHRAELLTLLGFDGKNGALSLGGVCKGIVRRSKSCGLDAKDVIVWCSLGYRAGRLVLSNELPPNADAQNGATQPEGVP